MRGKLYFAIVVVTATVVLIGTPAGADTAADKFGRGLAGMTTAFLEVPGNMVADTRHYGPAEGLPLGFAKGLGMIVPRTLVGVYEFVSAPFPAPAGYRPVLQPEYPWSYFQNERPSVGPRASAAELR